MYHLYSFNPIIQIPLLIITIGLVLFTKYENKSGKGVVIVMTFFANCCLLISDWETGKLPFVFFGIYVLFLVQLLYTSRTKGNVSLLLGDLRYYTDPNRSTWGLFLFFSGLSFFALYPTDKPTEGNLEISISIVHDIEENSKKLKDDFLDLQKSLTNQINEFELGINEIIDRLNEKSSEIISLNTKKAELEKKIADLMVFYNISEEQADAISHRARVKKPQEYIYDIFLSVFGGIIVYQLMKYIEYHKSSVKNKTKKDA
jgi:hypothetical protein